MRALFLGQPDIVTAAALWAWLDTGHEVAGIWLPARKADSRRHADWMLGLLRRRRSLAAAADAAGIVPRQVSRLSRSPDLLRVVQQLAVDLIVTASFPYLVPSALLSSASRGGVNLHGALLPRYRGAHPTFWMLRRGDDDACGGVTLHTLAPAIDAGDIIARQRVPRAGRSLDRWHIAMSDATGELVAGPLQAWLAGEIVARPQHLDAGSYQAPSTDTDRDVVSGWQDEEAARFLGAAGSRYPLLVVRPGGKAIRLGGPVRLAGAATGAAVRPSVRTVELDVGRTRMVARRVTPRHELVGKFRNFLTIVSAPRGSFARRRPAP